MEKIININGFEQGNITSSGNADSDYRIRTGYICGKSLKSVKISAVSTTGKALLVDLIGYSDNTLTTPIFDKYWYNVSYEFDLSSYTNIKYLRIVLKYSDDTKFTPDELSYCTLTEFFDWYADSDGIHCEGMPETPEKNISTPYPAALWRIDYISPDMPYHRLFPDLKAINMWSLPRENVIRVYDYREPQNGFKHNGLAILTPERCESNCEVNGRWDLEITHPIDDFGRWKYIFPPNIIKTNGQLFRIDSVKRNPNGNITAHANHIFYDLADKLIIENHIENSSGMQFIYVIMHSTVTDHDYSGYIFQYNSDIEKTASADFRNVSPVGALIGDDNSFINTIGGELYRNNFYFSINSRMENARDNAFSLRYGTNIEGITETIDYSEWCTYLICEDNFGNYFSVYHTPKEPIHHHKFKYYKFNYSEIYNSDDSGEKLRQDAYELWGKIWLPKVTYDINIAFLKDNPKYKDFINLENFNVGDSGTIYCEILGINTVQTIVSITRDELTGKATRIILGNTVSSIVRPSYKAGTISSGVSPSDRQIEFLHNQVEKMDFEINVPSPFLTKSGKFFITKSGKFFMYKRR